MALPTLPPPDMVHVDAQGYSTHCYTAESMQQYALAALRAQPAGWIDASKQMPPPQVRVLGLDPQHNIVEVDMWFGPDFQWGYSHWIPLPPPPAIGETME